MTVLVNMLMANYSKSDYDALVASMVEEYNRALVDFAFATSDSMTEAKQTTKGYLSYLDKPERFLKLYGKAKLKPRYQDAWLAVIWVCKKHAAQVAFISEHFPEEVIDETSGSDVQPEE